TWTSGIRRNASALPVDRRKGMMLMHDAPCAVDPAQTDRHPELKPGWILAGAAAHDAEGETHVVARYDAELLDIERLRYLVILEEQVPRLLVIFQAFGLQWRGQVEHHNIWRMQGQDRWQVMAPNGGGPRLEQGSDL